jgi:tetratricopeptide (TPR) repeat protein
VASLFRNFLQSKTPAATAAPEVDELYAEATRAYQEKDFARAVPLYERVIALQPDHAEAHYKRGNALKDLGQLPAALASYDLAVEHDPNFPYAWCNRGVVQMGLALYEPALASFDRAIELDPQDAVAHSNRASLLQGLSRWQEALASHDRVLALNPRAFQTWFARGNVLRELQQPDAALLSYQEAVSLQPDFAEGHYNCAVLLERRQQFQAALAGYDKAIDAHPGFPQAHFSRAGVLKNLERREEALAAYDLAIAAKADYAEAHTNRGTLLQELRRFDAALASYDKALEIWPDYAEGHYNRGTLLAARMQAGAALTCYDRAIELKPDFAEAYCERATVLARLGRWDECLPSVTQAVAIQPDFAAAQYNRSLFLLQSGDFANGWLSHEWRWYNTAKLTIGERRAFSRPLWLGEQPIAGKRLLLHNEQGLGDTLQFCRFANTLADQGATVILQVQPPLGRLLEKSLERVSRVVADNGGALPEYDYQCPLVSLPLALKTTLATIPSAAGYLRADPARTAQWQALLEPHTRPRVGLTWSGNLNHTNDQNRSFRLADWIEHLPRELDYVCLQKDVRSEDAETLATHPWIARFERELQDFNDAAALCASVDLVICVDTSIAHVSGALGKPTWVLLPFNPDWRWLLHRTDSPWYESVKLYRQMELGDWKGVFTRVAADLRTTIATAG